MIGSHHHQSLSARAVAFALGAIVWSAEANDAYEQHDSIAVADLLPATLLKSADFDIDPEAEAEGNFYRFHVTANGRSYRMTSLAMLRHRLHEIATTAAIEGRLDQSAVAARDHGGGRRGVGSEDVIDILSDPIGTSAHLLGNLQHNVEQTFIEGGSGVEAAARTRATGAQDLNPGPHKRSAAARLGVDVYTSNPVMQRVLEQAAAARSAGDAQATFSPLLLNRYAHDRFGSGVLNLELQSTLKNFGAAEISAALDEDMAGLNVPADLRIAFLTHPAYTPRSRLYFVRYAELLGAIRGVDLLFKAATAAATEADAVAYVVYLRMLAWYQLNGGGLREVITETRYPTIATARRGAVLALPLDYLAWSETVAGAATTLAAIMREHELAGFTVLLAGRPTSRARSELEARKVAVRPRYSY